MDETLDELLSMLPQQETYLEGLQRFSAEHRRLEWLSVRVLLFTLLGEEKEIAYYPSGKPYLADKSASISISHTRGYVSVIIGEASATFFFYLLFLHRRLSETANPHAQAILPNSSTYKHSDSSRPLMPPSTQQSTRTRGRCRFEGFRSGGRYPAFHYKAPRKL